MNNPQILKLKCPNPECGVEIRGTHPGKAGLYKITCNKCGKSLQLEIRKDNSNDVKLSLSSNNTMKAETAKVKVVHLDDDFYINEKYEVECPHCHDAQIELMSPKEGTAKKSCPKCGNVVTLDFKSHTYIAQFNDKGAPKIKLTYQIKGFLHSRKLEFIIKEGTYIIGRKDDSTPCEIPIANDPTMSRRSVEITGVKLATGYNYRLKVLKATNPVTINDIELSIGAVVALQPGDKFKLGKTLFKVEKA